MDGYEVNQRIGHSVAKGGWGKAFRHGATRTRNSSNYYRLVELFIPQETFHLHCYVVPISITKEIIWDTGEEM